MLDVLCSLAAAAAISLAAFGFGRPLWRQFRGDVDAPLETLLWSLVLGLLVAGLAITCLAEVGGLHELSLAFLTLAGVISAMVELACLAAGTKFQGLPGRAAGQFQRQWRQLGVWSAPITCAGLVLLATFAGALAPPIDADVLRHSLEPPKHLLLAGGFDGSEVELLRLDLSQVWSLWALGLEGPVAANLLHWCLAILLALAAVVLAGNWLKAPEAWLAGLLIVTCPAASGQFGTADSGIAAALTMTLSLVAALRAIALGQRNWLLMSALMLGAALAIDLLAGLLALLVVGAFLIAAAAQARRGLGELLPWLSVALLSATPWLAAASLPTFDGSSNDPLVWPVNYLGPVLLIGLGGLLLERRTAGNGVLWTACGALAGLALLPGQPAAGLIAIPLLAVTAARGAMCLLRVSPAARLAIGLLAFLAVAADLTGQFRQLSPRLAVASGWKSREDYLIEHQGAYRAAAVFNRIHRQGQRLLTLDAEGFYFAAPVAAARQGTGAATAEQGPNAEPETLAQPASDAAWAELARRQGFDYLLLAHREKSDPTPGAAGTAGEVCAPENLPHTAEVIPILEYRFADDNNRCIRYRLWKLQGSHAATPRTADTPESGDELSARPRTPAR